nr:uncharacterized protein LOC109158014 [Ipomoea batatas]
MLLGICGVGLAMEWSWNIEVVVIRTTTLIRQFAGGATTNWRQLVTTATLTDGVVGFLESPEVLVFYSTLLWRFRGILTISLGLWKKGRGPHRHALRLRKACEKLDRIFSFCGMRDICSFRLRRQLKGIYDHLPYIAANKTGLSIVNVRGMWREFGAGGQNLNRCREVSTNSRYGVTWLPGYVGRQEERKFWVLFGINEARISSWGNRFYLGAGREGVEIFNEPGCTGYTGLKARYFPQIANLEAKADLSPSFVWFSIRVPKGFEGRVRWMNWKGES